MYKLILPILAAGLVLTGCGNSGNNAQQQQAAKQQAPLPTSVTGTVSLKTPIPLSPSAQLKLALINVSLKTPVAQSTTPLTAVPSPFQLAFEQNKIDQNSFYVLDVAIADGERNFVAPRQYPVVTKGAPAKVDVVLAAEPTASEKLEAEYASLERAIGGMKIARGASEDEASTTAWDGFFDSSGLRYVREITDYGDKGRINTYFAYRDGKPMAVFKENVPAMSSRPNAVTRAGWNEQGALVLKTKREGGTTTELADNDAKSLHDLAVAKFDTVSKKRP
ncbi:MAG TPA: YbaY family lipoprotein [Tahibacter sp.]|nr:YbaY family lipoprotein [Tahibacter sp.]